ESLGHDDRAEATYRAMLLDLEDLAIRQPGGSSVDEELGWTLSQLAVVLGRHNRFQDAEALDRRALTIREALVTRLPRSWELRSQLAITLSHLAAIQSESGRYAEAERALLRAREMLRRLLDEVPGDEEAIGRLAKVEDNLGGLWQRMGRSKEGEEAVRRSVELYETRLTRDPGNPAYRSDVATSLINLNTFGSDPKKIFDRDRRIIAILGKLVEEFPDRPKYREFLSLSQSNHAITFIGLGKADEAKRVVGLSIATAERLAADFPSFPEYRALVARPLDVLIYCQRKTGEDAAAKQSAERILGIWESLLAEFPDKVIYRRQFSEFLTNEAERRLDSPDSARRAPGEAVKLARRACELSPDNQLCWKWLGLAEYVLENWDAAIKAEEKCIAIRGGGSWAFLELVLAAAHTRRGDAEKGREWYARAEPKLADSNRLGDTPRWFLDEVRSLLGTRPPDRPPATDPRPTR
ncbi:tetratricopeptide repeat protein, partial [Singulisphaera rosea]